MGVATDAGAKTFRYDDLSLDQKMALQRSEQRLATYDRALQALDVAREKGKISRRDYAYDQHDLVAFIGCEARYQNDIMTDDRPFPPEETREVMENIAKYAILVPAFIIGVVAKAVASSGASYTFSP